MPGLPASEHRAALSEKAIVYRADSSLALIPVSVTDSLNHPITGLVPESFRIYEGGVEQRILHLSREDVPLAVGLVFDTSMSMASKLPAARAAASAFLKTANPEDDFFLIEFQDHARVTQGLTDDPRDIEARLASASAKGHTALLDAVQLGVEELRKSTKPRKALLILSDGGDNRSRYTERDVIALLRESDITVYAMGLFPTVPRLMPEEDGDGAKLLEAITRGTGGRLSTVGDVRSLPEAAAAIGTELHNRYVLGYAPSIPTPAGRFRKVQVKVIPPRGMSALQVSWRPGYYEPRP